MCANVPTIFECINQRADAIKAARWAAYEPLTRRQLSDKPRRNDPELNTETVTLNVGVFGQFVVIKRPTEGAALHRDKYADRMVLSHPSTDWRWCIWCKRRHPVKDFVHSARYLHHLSYACKTSLREAKRRPWKFDKTN